MVPSSAAATGNHCCAGHFDDARRPAGPAASLRPVPAAAADLPLIASGKVREMYDLGDRLLMVASDRISTYDVVHPTPIPDKGKVLTGLSGVLVRQDRAHRRPTTSSRPPRACPTRCAAARWSCASCEMLPVECVVRGYITGLGLEGLPGDRQGLGHRAAARPARVRAAARADLHARRRRPRSATTRRSTSTAPPSSSATATLMARVARRLDRAVRVRRRPRARARRDPRRHEVRVRPRRRRRARRRRRGADARLLALLAGRRLRARPRAAELRQAVRARLGVRAAAGTRRRRRRRSPTTSSRARASATSRPTSASPASRSTTGSSADRRHDARARAHPARRRASSTRRASPSSARCRRSASRASSNVHVGRLVELDVEDPAQLDAMCRKLLANPLIEDYEIAARRGRA